jgi:hypothetical protein
MQPWRIKIWIGGKILKSPLFIRKKVQNGIAVNC